MSAKFSTRRRKRFEPKEEDSPLPQEISRHLVRAQEEERKRISRELHDDTGQALMLLRMHLGSLAVSSGNAEAVQIAQEALALLDQTIEGLRRTIAQLSPKILEELGLLAAIHRLVRDLNRATSIHAVAELPESLGEIPQESEIAIYRTVQEALNNAARHSQAKNLHVALESHAGWISFVVEDDGIGFKRSKTGEQTFGLIGMRDRIAAVGGNLKYRSAKGKGTEIQASVPILARKRGEGHSKKAAA